jgi:enterochelin esterase-like enzyme/outer membrane protein assembly factor BamB
MRAFPALVVLSACLVASVAVGADWPGFRGPNFDGTVPGETLLQGGSKQLEVGWKRDLGPGYSALAVGDGQVLAMFADGDADYLAAFDVATGDERWRYRIADTYAGHDGSHDGPISTPLIGDGRIYGLGAWGHLFAVNASDGKGIWEVHLADDLGGKKPHYGFTTSPLLIDGVLVIELGGEEGKAVAGLAPDTGKVLWTVGDDTIEYGSAIVATLGGQRQVVAAGKDNVWGIAPASGDVLWSYRHEGDEGAMGGMTVVPVPSGDDRIFLMNKVDSSVMLQVEPKGDGYDVSELWSNNAIKASYVTPVYHDGHLYGMSNRIFACVDAATGEIAWRSREPGDGFPTVVGDQLVMITKGGSLHVAEATPEAYTELARLDLFEEHAWSEVAYAEGHLFARSMAYLARIDPGSGGDAEARSTEWVARTEFGRFLDELERSNDKKAAIDAFLAQQDSFPIVEDNGAVHFLYRGEAEDVGIVGDVIGFRREDPMIRAAGTDLFHYSTRLEPNAAATYGYIVDFGEPAPDPMNDRAGSGLFGDVSWFAMPAWQAPDFLGEAKKNRQGRLEEISWKSDAREGQERHAQVYLPVGYRSTGDRRYPVAYVHHGKEALEVGRMKNALDNLIGDSVEPLIAVFVHADEENPRGDLRNDKYPEMVANELVPLIDEKYRTIADPSGRASVGSGRGANVAMMSAFGHSDVFGRTGAQSATLRPASFAESMRGADDQPMVIYLDWGTYHLRSPHEAWDLADASREVWQHLREHGYRPAGGEVPEGYSWQCWNGHTDEMLEALFPLRRGI